MRTRVIVAIAGVPASTRQSLLVATCHMHWDPEHCDVKLIQTMMFINELKKISDDNKQVLRPGGAAGSAQASPLPVILCGDLNSLPDSGETTC